MKSQLFPARKILIAAVLLLFGIFSFTRIQTTSITGKVTPAGSVNKIQAYMGTDSTASMPSTSGDFVLQVKAGTWKVVVDAKDPYKDAVKDNVTVEDGKSVNIGEIKLEK